jgi:GDPmannose 4,6-dehydratase
MSFDAPEITTNVNGLGVLKLLEAVKLVPGTRFYQASTSEMFGIVQAVPQNETTAFRPVSPYGTAKLFGYWTTINYRESYGVHASNGILFNHESPRRGLNFVTRKITNGLAKYKILDAPPIRLGNLDALRDWGHARDYVEGMWLMVQQSDPGDYVLATGQQHSVRQFCQYACQYFNIDLVWQGQGINEIGINTKTGQTVFEIDPRFYRPSDVNTLLGDSTLAKSQLGWSPKTTLQDLVEEMCSNDSELISKLQREK